MSAKIIFSDIDNNLNNGNLTISDNLKIGIRKKIINGDLFIPLSTYLPKAMMNVVSSITLSCPIISYSGGLVLDEMGQPLNSQFFSVDKALEIIKILPKDTTWNIYSGYNWFVPMEKSKFVEDEEKRINLKALPTSQEHLSALKGVHQMAIMDEKEKISSYKDILSSKFIDIDFKIASPNKLIILPKDVSKEKAIKIMAEYYGIDEKNYLFSKNNDELLQIITECNKK